MILILIFFLLLNGWSRNIFEWIKERDRDRQPNRQQINYFWKMKRDFQKTRERERQTDRERLNSKLFAFFLFLGESHLKERERERERKTEINFPFFLSRWISHHRSLQVLGRSESPRSRRWSRRRLKETKNFFFWKIKKKMF